jgi:hypothetical protein
VKNNAGAFVAVRFIVCSQYKADALFGGHAVFRAVLRPPATSAYTVDAAILIVLISGALGDSNHGGQNQQGQKGMTDKAGIGLHDAPLRCAIVLR